MKKFNKKNDNDIENNSGSTNQENSGNNKQYKKIKMSFIRKIKVSIFDFDKYYMIASESISRSLIFLLELFILFSVIAAFSVTYKISESGKEICDKIVTEIPEFTLENYELTCNIEEPAIIESNDEFAKFKVIFDNSSSNTYEEQFKDYNGYAIAFTKHNIIIKVAEDRIENYKYEDIKVDVKINKDTIVQLLQNNKIYTLIFIYIAILLFIVYFISMIIDILALAILGLIITKLVRLPLRFYSVFAIAVASTTLPIILNLLYLIANIFWNFTMPQFQVMITLVSYIYLIAGILILRSNLKKGTDNDNKNFDKKVNEEKGT